REGAKKRCVKLPDSDLKPSETVEILEWVALLWILALAKARVQCRYPQRSRPSEQRRPTPKSTQPLTARGRRAAGRVARSLQPHCGDAPPSLLAIRPSASTRDPSQYFNSLLAELTSARGGSFDCEPK